MDELERARQTLVREASAEEEDKLRKVEALKKARELKEQEIKNSYRESGIGMLLQSAQDDFWKNNVPDRVLEIVNETAKIVDSRGNFRWGDDLKVVYYPYYVTDKTFRVYENGSCSLRDASDITRLYPNHRSDFVPSEVVVELDKQTWEYEDRDRYDKERTAVAGHRVVFSINAERIRLEVGHRVATTFGKKDEDINNLAEHLVESLDKGQDFNQYYAK